MNPGRSIHDVIVVGAGPAGLITSERLSRLGHDVLTLEAGPSHFSRPSLLAGQHTTVAQSERDELLSEASSDRWRYTVVGGPGWWARAIAVGGRGNLWGGWLARFSRRSMSNWPYGVAALSSLYRDAERWLGAVRDTPDRRFSAVGRSLGFKVHPGTFATRLGCSLDQQRPLRLRPNAVVTCVEPGVGRCEVHLSEGGKRVVLSARHVIIAASPIETARLLLSSSLDHPWLGRRLTDHHMLGYLLYEPDRPPSLRPGAIPLPTATVTIPSHSKPRPQREFSLELLGPAPVSALTAEQRALLGLDHCAQGSVTYITAIGEQRAHAGRHVELSPRARDALGRHVPRIHLAWDRSDEKLVGRMKATCRAVAEVLATPGAELVRCRDPFVHPAIYHPAGTCGMARDAAAPCTPWGALRYAPGIWIADASVFPSSGASHPTLTVLAHALRVATAVDRALVRR